MIHITIDGQPLTLAEPTTIVTAAARLGIAIPTLCYEPTLPPQVCCMVCVVQVAGQDHLIPACGHPVSDGMIITTHSDAIFAARRASLELLLSEHYGDCVAPCTQACPAHMDVPTVARWVRSGDFAQALAVVRQTIALPGVLGHICPEPCAKGCHRSAHDGGLAVCALKRGLVAQELASGPISPPACAPDTGQSVAIVGTGPTGLAAAFELLQRGYRVTLIDKATQLGGALRTHVPPAELPPELLDAELDVMLRMGVTLRLGCTFGPELTVADLRGQYNAVLLALGPITPALAEAHGWPWRGQGVQTQSYRLGDSGLYAAGAMVVPTRLAVKGLAEGRKAAQQIHADFLAHLTPAATTKPMRFSVHRPHPHITVIPQAPAVTTHTPEAMSLEAQRCLQCGCAVADSCRLRNYAEEYGARWSTHNPTQIPPQLITSHPEVDIDLSKCIGCGLCVEVTKQAREPVGLTLAGRGLTFQLATPLGASWSAALTHSTRRCAEVCPTGAIVRRGGTDDT